MCQVVDCETKRYAKGLCHKHYKRQLRYGSTDDPAIAKGRNPRTGFCHQCGEPAQKVFCSVKCSSNYTSTKYNSTEAGKAARLDVKHRRRAQSKGEPLPRNWKIKLLRLYPTCLVCGTDEDLTVDHVVPLAKGGKHEFDNFQVLCRSHNSAKGVGTTDYRSTS